MGAILSSGNLILDRVRYFRGKGTNFNQSVKRENITFSLLIGLNLRLIAENSVKVLYNQS